jgi:transitional endoplasmic reticulum ATPase
MAVVNSRQKREVKLKVAEAQQDDINKGIVRIDSQIMKELGIQQGSIVEIESTKKTVAIAGRAFPADIGSAILRMDPLTRKNSGASVGEYVTVRSIEIKPAGTVTIAPAQKNTFIQAHPDIFKRALTGRAVVKGDIISLGGTRRRRITMTGNPFFDDVFKMMADFDDFNVGFGFGGDIKYVVVNTSPKEPVIITDDTEVEVLPEAVELKEEKGKSLVDIAYEDIGGLGEELNKVREMIELPLKRPELFETLGVQPPKGVLLYGPPGTGKTLIARAVANETKAYFISIAGPEVMNKFVGEAEKKLRDIFAEAEKSAPSIIFIDEIDAIAPKREESYGEVERRVVAQLLSLMDGLKTRGRVIVIAATNRPDALDPALRRGGRFDREIEIGVPNKEGRLEILKIHTRNMPISDEKNTKLLNEKEKEALLDGLATITHGFVGADLEGLCKEAAMVVLRRVQAQFQDKLDKLEERESIPTEILEKLQVSKIDFKDALKMVRPSAMREVLIETPKVNWVDIGGLETVKQETKEAIEWPLKSPEVFKRMGIRPPKGILFYGPPGCGKTLVAKAVAAECQANFICIKGPEVISKWVGESEKAIREIFKKARQVAPCIVFFDEIDSIASKRGGSADNKVTERVVDQLLTEMDGLEEMSDVVVLAATNRPELLDAALLRPGRFDRFLLIPPPKKGTRFKILKIHTKNMPISLSKEETKKIDEEYACLDKADIEESVREGTQRQEVIQRGNAGHALSKEDFEILGDKKSKLSVDDEDKMPLAKNTMDKWLQLIAKKMVGYSGADIEAVCREAAMLALREDIRAKDIKIAHFDEALEKTRPSLDKRIIEKYTSNMDAAKRGETAYVPAYMG